jgi:hypothetical protein
MFFLTNVPSFKCISCFTTTFLFLLKKTSEEGISSIEIGVRSLMYIALRWGVPKLECKGVNVVIGLPNSVNYVPSALLGVSTRIVDDKGEAI